MLARVFFGQQQGNLSSRKTLCAMFDVLGAMAKKSTYA